MQKERAKTYGAKIRRQLLSGMVVVAMAWPAAAFAQGGSVRYSYEKVEVGGQADWVLVPIGEATASGKASEQTAQKAFEGLKRAKRATYGKSTLKLSGKFPEKTKAVVTIDPQYSRYALIIIAETVYTLTELGISGVEFPGHASGEVTRKDVPFTAYTLTVPLWKVLPPGKISGAQVQMPDGALVPSHEIDTRWKSDSAGLRALAYGYLKSDDVFTVVSVARMLPGLGNFQADAMIPLLENPARQVRQVALEVLKDQTNNEKVLAAVVQALAKEQDEEMALDFATYLGQAKQPEYSVHQQYFFLTRSKDEKVSAKAAEKLGERSGDAGVVAHLRAALEDKRESVAKAAASSLGKLKADNERIDALASDKVSAAVRMQLAEDVASGSKDTASQGAALLYLAKNSGGTRSLSAIESLGALKTDSARKSVESFLKDPLAERREAARKALQALGHVESVSSIAEAIRANTDVVVMEETGYEIMAAQSMDIIISSTSNRDNLVQRLAFRALGARAVMDKSKDKRVVDTLESGTRHKDPLIRGAAARAMGTLATADSLKVLTGMVDDKSAPVRRDVALALGNYKNGEQVDVLVKYLDDSSPEVISGAIDAMEQRQEALSWKKIWSLAEHPDAGVRASALRALTTLVDRQDKEAVRQVVSLLGGAVTDKSPLVQLQSLAQLGRFNDEMAVTSIAIRVSAEEKELRLAAIRALGAAGHLSGTPLVVRALDDSDLQVRRAAVEALGQLKDSSAKSSLQKRVELEQDAGLVELIRATLKTI